MRKNFNPPVLFLIFNRPDTTKRVFEEIRKIKPKQLFIAADGPRKSNPGEKEKCEKTRKSVLDKIDWDCEVKTLFREKNLGCGKAVSSAITWFFDNVKEGIVLEDDCLPNSSFFPYCEELLERYRDNKKVMHISGDQFIPNFDNGASYYFAKLMHCWGWASWADRWKHYDLDLKNFKKESIKNFSSDKTIQSYWLDILKRLKKKEIDTWDYQWSFKIVEKNGLCINPSKNLVSNIGCGENSTHTPDKNCSSANLPTYKIKKLVHPAKVELDRKAADYLYQNHCGIDLSPDSIPCKICHTKSKKIFKKNILGKHSVAYYRCPRCGFMQTEKPHWFKEAYSKAITSTDVGLVNRNIYYSNIVEHILLYGYFEKSARFLDFAGGYGMFTRIMRDKGFDFYHEDKYCENLFAKHFNIKDLPERSRKFELVTAFELMEHVEDPFKELDYIFSLTDSFLFTTDLIPTQGLEDWWYLGTEHGQHISFYTRVCLRKIAAEYNKNYYSNGSLHLITSKKNLGIFKKVSPLGEFLKKIKERVKPLEKLPPKTWNDFEMVTKKEKNNA